MKRTMIIKITVLVIMLLYSVTGTIFADDWFEDEKGYYTLVDMSGNELTIMARKIYVDDEYISGDNKHYSVVKVDVEKRKAYAKYLGQIKLVENDIWPDYTEGYQPVSAAKKGSIVLYCTHSDESYVPTDGKESIKGKGGIFDVAESFRSNLEKKGANAILDKTPHDPHDAGAYRRSRQTAINLIRKNSPVTAKFDIHRDAVPKRAYLAKISGQPVSKIRIVIGRRNQNRKANEELARKIKDTADKNYPNLIKDIFIGRGMYNQELSPRSLLFEVGTYENSKEEAQRATAYLADVVVKTLYGGKIQPKDEDGNAKENPDNIIPIDKRKTTGGGSGIIWLIIIAVVGGIGFLLISTGGKEIFSKASNAREEFGGLFGRKKNRK